MLISTINQKSQPYGLEVVKINTYEAKASQYNHMTDTYSKKELKEQPTWANHLTKNDLDNKH